MRNLIIGILIGFISMYIINQIINKCWISNDTKSFHIELIKKLVRQTARWSTAAIQDDNPIIAVLHANYSTGYLWALKDIATDQEIYDSTGLDIIKFKQKIIDIQDKSTRRVSKACPDFLGDIDEYLLKVGGDL